MFNNPYMQQQNLDKINDQIKQLENIRNQIQQPIQPITQNFQLSPGREMRFSNSLEEVNKEYVIGDTPFFSKDMAVLWVKKTTGDVKTYELREIIEKDEKDLHIEFLQAQIEELKKGGTLNESDGNTNESVKNKKSSNSSEVSKHEKQ